MSCDTEQQKGSDRHKLQHASFLLLQLLPALLCQLSQLYRDCRNFAQFNDHMEQKVSGLTLVISVVPLLTFCLNQEKHLKLAQECGPGNFTQNKIYCLTDKIVQLLIAKYFTCTSVWFQQPLSGCFLPLPLHSD